MSERRKSPAYLRLVAPIVSESARPTEATRPTQRQGEILLGFLNTSRTSRAVLEKLIAEVRPAWVFDLRPLPYFDIGGLSRLRVFEMFREHEIRYRDVSGLLGLVERNDASLNSGAVANVLNELLAERNGGARQSAVVLLDDDNWLQHSLEVLPGMLREPADGWNVQVIGDSR